MDVKYLLITKDKKELLFSHWLDMMAVLAKLVDRGETVCVKRLNEHITN